MTMDAPTIFNDAIDLERVNLLLDQITEKPFLSPFVAVQAVRLALEFHGVKLPKLDCETQIEGPNTLDALKLLMTGKRVETPAINVEYAFKVEEGDYNDSVGDENGLYFYFVMDRNDEVGVYQAYAQLVDKDDLNALLNMSVDGDVDLDGKDINGEDPFLKQVKHSGTGGFKGDD
jgi:hypothetical protein